MALFQCAKSGRKSELKSTGSFAALRMTGDLEKPPQSGTRSAARGSAGARAEDDVRVAELDDVFARRDELLHGAHVHPALEQHARVASGDGLADLPEQGIVQRIARADLQAVRARFERELQMFLVHHLRVH